jgi:hypothetical protein
VGGLNCERRSEDEEDAELIEEAIDIMMELRVLRRKTTRYWSMKLMQRDMELLEACDDTLNDLDAWLLEAGIRWRIHFEQDVTAFRSLWDAYGTNAKPENRFLAFRTGVKYGRDFRNVPSIWRDQSNAFQTKVSPETVKANIMKHLSNHRDMAEADWKVDVTRRTSVWGQPVLQASLPIAAAVLRQPAQPKTALQRSQQGRPDRPVARFEL